MKKSVLKIIASVILLLASLIILTGCGTETGKGARDKRYKAALANNDTEELERIRQEELDLR